MKVTAAVRIGWPGWLLLVCPGMGWAHSPVPGLGRFYSGMLHPVIAPAALIALVAVGLLIGQRGLAHSRRATLVFLMALALGGIGGSQWATLDTVPWAAVDTALLGLGLVAAICVLVSWQPSALPMLALACSIGFMAGVSLSDMAAGAGRWVVLSGTWMGGAFLALGVAAVSELARRNWQRIAVRVVASWLAACALLVSGLQFVGPMPKGETSQAASGIATQRN